jgi:8-oxo-dGTP pyrophosphatase MutT (NUDIX family)
MKMLSCRCGRLHYGQYGAAGLVLTNADGHLLLARRSDYVHRPGTWAFPGGAVEPGESAAECAVREAEEELGLRGDAIMVTGTAPGLDHGVWRYTYVLATVAPAAPQIRFHLNWETDDVAWVPLEQVSRLRLHPDLRTAWPNLRDLW